ncbi:MAG: VTT domain-containing protein [Chloroflexota bacterium]
MILSSLLIGSGVLYLGTRLYGYRNKQQRVDTLTDELLEDVALDTPMHEGLGGSIKKERKTRLRTDILLGTGLVAAGCTIAVIAANGVTPLSIVNSLIGFLGNTPYGPALFISAYAVRPLILFPASLLTIAAGLLFGPVGGILYTVIGGNISALVAYSIGRRLRQAGSSVIRSDEHQQAALENMTQETMTQETMTQETMTQETMTQMPDSWQLIEPYIERVQSHPFTTVLTMRCLFLPYDLVNYGAGMLDVEWKPFLMATALGSLPGTVAFVLAGASIQGSVITGFPSLNPALLTASGVVFGGSLLLSRYLNQNQPTLATAESP